PSRRAIGMVFQDYALFPHLTVGQNVAFGLRGVDRRERDRRSEALLDLVGLAGTQGRYPHELSGGQQQRVALARALAPRPHLLLMDEPFSNLDVTLRERLALEVRDILKASGATALFVTHNQLEAFAVADQIGVMRGGALLQWDSGYDLYHRPVDPGVARFVGEGVLLPGTVRGEGQVDTGLGTVRGEAGVRFPAGSPVDVLVRPEDVVHDDGSPVKAEVVRRCFRGPNLLYGLRLDNGDLVQALVPSHCTHSPGERIGIRPDVRHLVLFAR
ncbi:MAG: ABC transporter ATP-binding protein, partial [Deferrisomatales bacterium]